MKKLALPLMLILMIFTNALAQEKAEDLSDEALFKWAIAMMQRAVVIDTHSDTVSALLNSDYDMSKYNSDRHIDIPRMMEGGVDGQFFACWISPTGHKGVEIQRTLEMIDALQQVAEKDDRFVIAYTADEILKAKSEGKVSGVLCVEGGHAINDSIPVLRLFYQLGVRYMTLTWMNHNNWADASGPDQSRYGSIEPHGGLTDLGKDIIREMNRLGMIVDVSHVHDDTFWDVMEITTKPVIASHSCSYALNPHYRNVKDDMLKAIAKNGGVLGINFAPGFLSAEYNEKSGAIREEMMKKWSEIETKYKDQPEKMREERRKLRASMRGKVPKVPLSVLVDHIEHVAKVAGIDHIGFGSDFDGIGDTPEKIDDCSDLFYIIIELRKRGWSDVDIRKFLGENFLRVLRANEVSTGE